MNEEEEEEVLLLSPEEEQRWLHPPLLPGMPYPILRCASLQACGLCAGPSPGNWARSWRLALGRGDHVITDTSHHALPTGQRILGLGLAT